MPKITSLDELGRLKDELVAKRAQEASRGITHVTVGMGTCGIAAGARVVLQALEAEIEACHANDVVITQTGCVGLCGHEPIRRSGCWRGAQSRLRESRPRYGQAHRPRAYSRGQGYPRIRH